LISNIPLIGRSYRTVPPIPDQPLPGFKEIPELLARFGRPRSVSVGPQSEIDVWEQIDYRDERRRRRSNSTENNMSGRDGNKFLNSIVEQSFTDDTLLDDQEEKMLRTNIEEPRIKYDVEVVTKLIVYGGNLILTFILMEGIGWLSVDFLPVAFQALGL
jgi:dihydrosphingosine 1-phosphate phosphatase